MVRALVITALLVTVASCSSSPKIPSTVSGQTTWASASGVKCASQCPTVTVTGVLTGKVKTPAHSGVVVTAILYNASGHQVRQGIWSPSTFGPRGPPAESRVNHYRRHQSCLKTEAAPRVAGDDSQDLTRR